MVQSVDITRRVYVELEGQDPSKPVRIPVSFDGSWFTREHSSLYGFGAVIDLLTGLIMDFTILSKHCQRCSLKLSQYGGVQSHEFVQWYEQHKDNCDINYEGSSNAMEKEAAAILWSRSRVKNIMMYTTFPGDGDPKAYNEVVELQPYGPEVEIIKEECLNHVDKRFLTAILNIIKVHKLGGKGEGRLTQGKALKLQGYYRLAVINNLNNVEAMRTTIWATLFHLMSTDQNPQHGRCPQGALSWCFYQKALANDLIPGFHKENISCPLSVEVAEVVKVVYEKMSNPNLLKRIIGGLTQNCNECLHSS